MKKQPLSLIFAVLSAVFFLSGCALFSPEVKGSKYYDLNYGNKEKLQVNCRFETRNFYNISPARLNLLYSGKNSVVELDQYHYWVQSPEIMLRRYFLNAVETSTAANVKVFDASLTIFDFKFDMDSKESVLGVQLVLRDKSRDIKFEKNYVIKVPAAGMQRVDYVAAMNKCAEEFINQAVKDIKKF